MGEVEGLIRMYGVLAVFQLKPRSSRGVSHQTAYMGNCYCYGQLDCGLLWLNPGA